MKLKYCLLAMLWPVLNSCAQKAPATKPLTVGDTIPHIILTDVVNFPDSKIDLSKPGEKLTILDFWATWCNSCIHNFPKLDSLQKKFNGRLQIVLVNSITGTGDTREKIDTFFKKWQIKNGKPFELSYTAEDTLLKKLFPHLYVPHYIWIGQGNKIIAITGSGAVTEENIAAILNGSNLQLPQKRDEESAKQP